MLFNYYTCENTHARARAVTHTPLVNICIFSDGAFYKRKATRGNYGDEKLRAALQAIDKGQGQGLNAGREQF